MTFQQFHVSDTNPNDTTGGGGCICSPERQIDCKPPYAIFYGNDMENIASPHVVACQACLGAAFKACSGEVSSAGEKGGVTVMPPNYYRVDLPAPVTDAEVVDDDEDLPDV